MARINIDSGYNDGKTLIPDVGQPTLTATIFGQGPQKRDLSHTLLKTAKPLTKDNEKKNLTVNKTSC